MSEFRQFIFKKHNIEKFTTYQDTLDKKGFTLPNEENDQNIYLFDDDNGWADYNGCYYSSEGNSAGWVILSEDKTKFQRFDMNKKFVEEQINKYYGNLHTAKRDNSNNCASNQQQKSDDFIEKKNNNNNQQKKDVKKKQQEVNNEENNQQKNEKSQHQNEKQKKQKENRNKNNNKYNDKKKQNENDNEYQPKSEYYYILDIQDLKIQEEEFTELLHKEYNIQKDQIVSFEKNQLKIKTRQDALKIVRNQNSQFIVSV